jgi:hypothetical protein
MSQQNRAGENREALRVGVRLRRAAEGGLGLVEKGLAGRLAVAAAVRGGCPRGERVGS